MPEQGGRFAQAVANWQRIHGRHDLPWQGSRDAYRIWLSEVMLQQTRVETVLPYYERFLERFPDVSALAAASLDEVMALWSGLGYYSRARNLHRCAQEVVALHDGAFPVDPATLQTLPGIGRSTAGAIAVFAAGQRAAILDGNVRRVLCRVFGVTGWPGHAAVLRQLWALAERELPDDAGDMVAYTQGMMDLGATVCLHRRPQCALCPVRQRCIAHAEGLIEALPAAAPQRERPTRICSMFVFMHDAKVLLQRRPSSGIWGGLWSLPQTEFRARANEPEEAAQVEREDGGTGQKRRNAKQEALAAMGAASRLLGLQCEATRTLPAIRQEFTHFRLIIEPMVCEVSAMLQPSRVEHGSPVVAAAAAAATEQATALLKVAEPPPVEQAMPLQWMDESQALEAGLPQPVRRLLEDVFQQRQP